MKKMLVALALSGLPFVAMSQETPNLAFLSQEEWVQQVPAGDIIAQQGLQQTEAEAPSPAMNDAPAETMHQGNFPTSEIGTGSPVTEAATSQEIAGFQQASAAASGKLSTGAMVGIGIAAAAVLYSVVSGNDSSSASSGTTGTR